jgi:hypothetical protein
MDDEQRDRFAQPGFTVSHPAADYFPYPTNRAPAVSGYRYYCPPLPDFPQLNPGPRYGATRPTASYPGVPWEYVFPIEAVAFESSSLHGAFQVSRYDPSLEASYYSTPLQETHYYRPFYGPYYYSWLHCSYHSARLHSPYYDDSFHASCYDASWHLWAVGNSPRFIPATGNKAQSTSLPAIDRSDNSSMRTNCRLARLPAEIHMEVIFHLLCKDEDDYVVELESAHPEGDCTFSSRCEGMLRPYLDAWPSVSMVWAENRSALLKRVARVQTLLLARWRRTARSKYLKARMRYLFWFRHHELTPFRKRRIDIVDRVCSAYEEYLHYDLLEGTMAADLKELKTIMLT